MTQLVRRPQRQMTARPQRRWDPSREMEDIQDRFNQLVQQFFGTGRGRAAAPVAAMWPVPADIEETDDAYLVEIDLPNVRPEDVNAEVRENELRIWGVFTERERVGIMRRQNRPVGEFEYVVTLPADANPDDVDARLAGGVLTVRVGKFRENQPRRIEVKAS